MQPAHAPLPTGNDEEQAQLEEAAILFVAAGLLRHDFPGVPDSGAAADRDKIPAGRIRPGPLGREAVMVVRSGGPFGAAIFESVSGRVVAVGMNCVVRLNNCTLHGEMMAFMMAQKRVGSFTLNAPNLPSHELHTSCEPCAMCLGASLWSGVRRVVYGAAREDASMLNFEEGPVFPESYRYLEDRNIEIVRDVLREEARAVLEAYRAKSGQIYNG